MTENVFYNELESTGRKIKNADMNLQQNYPM